MNEKIVEVNSGLVALNVFNHGSRLDPLPMLT